MGGWCQCLREQGTLVGSQEMAEADPQYRAGLPCSLPHPSTWHTVGTELDIGRSPQAWREVEGLRERPTPNQVCHPFGETGRLDFWAEDHRRQPRQSQRVLGDSVQSLFLCGGSIV